MKKENTRMRFVLRRLAALIAALRRASSASNSPSIGALPTGEPIAETAIPADLRRLAARSSLSGPSSMTLTAHAVRSSNAPTPCSFSVEICSSRPGAISSAKALSGQRSSTRRGRRDKTRGGILQELRHRLAAVLARHCRQEHGTTCVPHGAHAAQRLCVQEAAVVFASHNQFVVAHKYPQRKQPGSPRRLALFPGVVIARTRSNLRRAPQHPVSESQTGPLRSLPERAGGIAVQREVTVVKSPL